MLPDMVNKDEYYMLFMILCVAV